MKVALLSDSHGDILTLKKVINYLNNLKINMLIHLGDNFSDLNDIEILCEKIYKIPGTRDTGYDDINKRTDFIEINGFDISLCHFLEDLKYQSKIIMYGHTHVPKAFIENNVLYLNPGHIIDNKLRHPFPTFMILNFINLSKINVKILNINFDIVFENDFEF